MSTDATAPDTIVLIHGFWVTPRSWEHWVAHYEAGGYKVLAPAYPGFEVEVEALNADPTPIESAHRRRRSSSTSSRSSARSSTPPILMGHSAGGVFTQILLDHGFGAAGVALNSAPTEGVKVVPLSQIKADVPGAEEPGQPRTAPSASRFEQWHYAFTNTLQRGGVARAVRALPRARLRPHLLGQRARERQARPPGRRWVELRERRPRAAALRLRQRGPPHAAVACSSRTRSTTRPNTVTEVKEFEGPHLLPAARRAGSRSPTTRSTGPSSTRRARPRRAA